MKLYISGAITNDPDYIAKFSRVETELKNKGFIVINPAMIPKGFEYEDYMHVDYALIDICDGVYMLKDWTGSRGAKDERRYAYRTGKKVLYE
jgi:hypothetical protein